jgi:acyl-CoA thioester hydrolase
VTAPAGYVHYSDVRVRFAETDAQGVVYHSNFLIYCEVARVEYFRALSRGRASAWEGRGFEVLIAHAECDYRSSARFDDELRIWTRIAAVGRSSFTFTFQIVRADGRLICEAKTVQVAIAKATGTPTPLPAEWVAELQEFEPALR